MAEVAWTEVEDELPAPEIITNKDGTKTIISYRLNSDDKKVKMTKRIKDIVIREKVHPLVAERKTWKKYGQEAGVPPGPQLRTTQLGDAVQLKLSSNWKKMIEDEQKQKQESVKKTGSKVVLCRHCSGEHFTAKCPYQNTLVSGMESQESAAPSADVSGVSDSGVKGNSYVPPHMRNRKDGAPPLSHGSGGRFERDDSTTLRITQLNELVNEDMLAHELLQGYSLQKVTLVRNRETRRSKGLAYVAFSTISEAERALNNLNGKGYHNLILHLEWSKPKPRT